MIWVPPPLFSSSVRLQSLGEETPCGMPPLPCPLWSNGSTCHWSAPEETTACAWWDVAEPARRRRARPSRTPSSNKPGRPERRWAVSRGATLSPRPPRPSLLLLADNPWPLSPVERVQAMFTILKSFGCVSSQHSDASSRFAMVFSLDFNHAGQAAAGHLQARNKLKHTPWTKSDMFRFKAFMCFFCIVLLFTPTRPWCWTNGGFVSRLRERVTSWSSLRCWQASAQRWGQYSTSRTFHPCFKVKPWVSKWNIQVTSSEMLLKMRNIIRPANQSERCLCAALGKLPDYYIQQFPVIL